MCSNTINGEIQDSFILAQVRKSEYTEALDESISPHSVFFGDTYYINFEQLRADLDEEPLAADAGECAFIYGA